MNKYKVLSAMLNLGGEFTAEDLAVYSGVNLNTVRVVLGRSESLIEHVRTQDTGQRGGQFKVYRLKDDCVESLREQIQRMYASLVPTIQAKEGKTDLVPISLRAADDVLRRRYPEASSVTQQQRLFELAEIRMTSARQDVELLSRQISVESGENLKFWLRSLESLQDLCAKELALASGNIVPSVDVLQILNTFKALADEFSRKGEDSQAAALLGRVVGSPVLTQAVVGVDTE